MKVLLVLFISVVATAQSEFKYPEVRRDNSVVDEYQGGLYKVPDPYRWLDDPDSKETKDFVEAQNKLTEDYLRGPDNGTVRERILETLTEANKYPKYSTPFREGSRYFYLLNSGLQNQHVIYMQNSLEDEPRVFLDPNTLSEDGTVSLNMYEFSHDGELFAYGLTTSGSDWVSIKVRNVSSGRDFPDVLTNVKFSYIKWSKNNDGFFYARYPNDNEKGKETGTLTHQKIYFHKVGTSQKDDILAIEFPDNPTAIIGLFDISRNGEYLYLFPTKGAGASAFYYAPLDKNGIQGKLQVVPVSESFEDEYQFVTNDDSIVYVRTNRGAPNHKVVAVDLNKPQELYWATVVPENPTKKLQTAKAIHEDKLILIYVEDVKSKLEVRHLRNGSFIQNIDIDIGSNYVISGKREHSEFFFDFTSFLTPGRFYRVDMKQEPYEAKLYREVNPSGFDVTKFAVSQVFYTSKDGTRVPMFIVHKKDYIPQGNSPAFLYGYGGFGIDFLPYYEPAYNVFVKHFDGIFALANIRGGGEYGENWHKTGSALNKQNSFDDFQAAAQYLYDHKYTSPKHLFINGGSNGGLLVAACTNQRPDLFGATVGQVGVYDLLRFQKFTIGSAWCTEYGCSDDKNVTVFENLKRLSPLHNVRVPEDPSVQYPAVLLLTGDHDDRVVPSHSYKLISELQHTVGRNAKQTNPLLLKVQTKAGHGGGKPVSAQLKEYADMYTFLVRSLNFTFVP